MKILCTLVMLTVGQAAWIHLETRGTADAGLLPKTQSAGGTPLVMQHLWREWADIIVS